MGDRPVGKDKVGINEHLANTVRYEFDMFAFLYDELTNLGNSKMGTGRDPREDALLESLGVTDPPRLRKS
jgi:hypothetical protein